MTSPATYDGKSTVMWNISINLSIDRDSHWLITAIKYTSTMRSHHLQSNVAPSSKRFLQNWKGFLDEREKSPVAPIPSFLTPKFAPWFSNKDMNPNKVSTLNIISGVWWSSQPSVSSIKPFRPSVPHSLTPSVAEALSTLILDDDFHENLVEAFAGGLSSSSPSLFSVSWDGSVLAAPTTKLEASDTLNRLFLHHQHHQEKQGLCSLVTRPATVAGWLAGCSRLCGVTWPKWPSRTDEVVSFRQEVWLSEWMSLDDRNGVLSYQETKVKSEESKVKNIESKVAS